MKIAINQEAKVAVMTDNDSTKHVIRILKRKRHHNDDYCESEYKTLRLQKRNLPSAMKRINMKEYDIVLTKDSVPNAMNVLPRAKEVLKNNNVPFKPWYNNIKTCGKIFEQTVEKILNLPKIFSNAIAIQRSISNNI
jgi:hypothetical protein